MFAYERDTKVDGIWNPKSSEQSLEVDIDDGVEVRSKKEQDEDVTDDMR